MASQEKVNKLKRMIQVCENDNCRCAGTTKVKVTVIGRNA